MREESVKKGNTPAAGAREGELQMISSEGGGAERKSRRRVASVGKKRAGRSNPKSGNPSLMGGKRRHSFEVKRKAVQLYLEEGIGAKLVAQELGVTARAVWDWARHYKKYGEEGLRGLRRGRTAGGLSRPVAEKAEEVKRAEPEYGVKRISQILKRMFFMQASPETVRKHLKKVEINSPKAKVRRKPKVPERRFEAATPNQMWQSDITYYPIQGNMAYIIGFIDDNSRYIVSLGLYRSQTSG